MHGKYTTNLREIVLGLGGYRFLVVFLLAHILKNVANNMDDHHLASDLKKLCQEAIEKAQIKEEEELSANKKVGP